jgi:hypothetical protein
MTSNQRKLNDEEETAGKKKKVVCCRDAKAYNDELVLRSLLPNLRWRELNGVVYLVGARALKAKRPGPAIVQKLSLVSCCHKRVC